MGTGGMRYGAGRPGRKVKAGQLLNLDIRALARLGYTKRNCSFVWQWARNGETTGSISIAAQAGTALTLIYTATLQGQARDCAQRVELAYTDCHFGRARPWALCPRCRQRVAVLYLRAGQFACRHCQRVSYGSQSQDALDRTWCKQRKIEAKLGNNLQRPKGMRQCTYDRLMAELLDCHQRRDAALEVLYHRMAANLASLELATPYVQQLPVHQT